MSSSRRSILLESPAPILQRARIHAYLSTKLATRQAAVLPALYPLRPNITLLAPALDRIFRHAPIEPRLWPLRQERGWPNGYRSCGDDRTDERPMCSPPDGSQPVTAEAGSALSASGTSLQAARNAALHAPIRRAIPGFPQFRHGQLNGVSDRSTVMLRMGASGSSVEKYMNSMRSVDGVTHPDAPTSYVHAEPLSVVPV